MHMKLCERILRLGGKQVKILLLSLSRATLKRIDLSRDAQGAILHQ